MATSLSTSLENDQQIDEVTVGHSTQNSNPLLVGDVPEKRSSTGWVAAGPVDHSSGGDGNTSKQPNDESLYSSECGENLSEALTDCDLFGKNEPPYEHRYMNGRLRRFRPPIFAFELVTQTLWPLSIPVVVGVQGMQAAQNKHLLPKCSATGFYNFLQTVVVAVLTWVPPIFIFFVFQLKWLYGLQALFIMLPIVRLLVLSGKYANFTTEYYELLMTSPQNDCTESLLLHCWYRQIAPVTQEALLQSAFRYSGVPVDELKDITFVCGKKMKAHMYMRRLIGASFGVEAPPLLIHFSRCVSFIVMPVIPLLTYHSHFGFDLPQDGTPYDRQIQSVVMMASLVVVAIYFAPAVFGYLSAGALHYIRKHELLSIIMEAALQTNSNQRKDPYMIPITNPDNLDTWIRLRIVSRYFGRVYEHRIAWNTFVFALVLFVSFLQMLVSTFFGDSGKDKALKVSVFSTFVIVSIFSFITILYAVWANTMDSMVNEMLCNEETLLLQRHKKDDDLDPAERTLFMNKLRAARALVDVRQQFDPVEVGHVPATPSLITSFGGALFSVISFNVITLYGNV